MTDSRPSPSPPPDHGDAARYRIRLRGHLGRHATAWFEGFAWQERPAGETVLVGAVADQAQLHGLLRKIRDLGLPLLEVARLEPRRSEEDPVDRS